MIAILYGGASVFNASHVTQAHSARGSKCFSHINGHDTHANFLFENHGSKNAVSALRFFLKFSESIVYTKQPFFEHLKHDAQTHSARGSKSFSQFINRVNAIRSGEQVFSVQNARVIVILSGGASVFRIKNVSGGAFCTGEQVIFTTQKS